LGEGTIEDGSRPGESGRQRMISGGFPVQKIGFGKTLGFLVVWSFFVVPFHCAKLLPLLCVVETSIYR